MLSTFNPPNVQVISIKIQLSRPDFVFSIENYRRSDFVNVSACVTNATTSNVSSIEACSEQRQPSNDYHQSVMTIMNQSNSHQS